MSRNLQCSCCLVLLFATTQTIAAVSVSYSKAEVLEGESFPGQFTCLPANSSNTLSWTLVKQTGQRVDIATCATGKKCTRPLAYFSVDRRGSGIYLSKNRLTKDEAGTYICSEHHSDGSVTSAKAFIQVVSVQLKSHRGCDINSKAPSWDVSRDIVGNKQFTCKTSGKTRPLKWSLVTTSGVTKHLGSCYDKSNCTPPFSPDMEVKPSFVPYGFTGLGSTLSVRVRRTTARHELAGTLICSFGEDSSNCTMDIYEPVEHENCQDIRVDPGNWSVVTSCHVTSAYSALGRYGYSVRRHFAPDLPHADSYKPLTWTMYGNDRRPFTLLAYNDTGTGSYRGPITLSWPLSAAPGHYTYSANLYPGTAESIARFGGQILVERPSPPSVQCEGALRDAGRVPCVCSTSSLGSPAGRLIWFSGDTVLAAGQYGVTTLQFPSNVTFDGCDVMQITCQLDWLVTQNSTITVSPECRGESGLLQDVAVGCGAVLAVMLVMVVVVLQRARQ